MLPFPLPDTVGLHKIDVGHAGSDLPESDDGEPIYAGFIGALASPDVNPPNWPDPHKSDLQTELSNMLDLAASVQPDGDDDTDPIVGPPLYGRWHAAVQAVPAAGATPQWLRELNLEPPLRATAGLGADTVRANQEDLMQQAWEQIGDVLEANRKLRQAQLAREASNSIKKRHFDNAALSDDMRVQIASPALSRIPLPSTGVTAGGELRASSLPAGTASGAMRRFARPAGPVSKHSGSDNTDWAGRVLDGLANPDSGLTLGNELLPPEGMGTIGHLLATNAPTGPGQTPATLFTDYAAFEDDYRQDPPLPADMTTVRGQVTAALDPATAVTDRIKTRIAVSDDYWARPEPLDPVMAAPEFTRPMYETVATKWLVPGLEVMPDDSLSILEVNPDFIEAYMVGLSHEMARELLWREYPTDQRGTYFRQFWDVRGKVPPPATDAEIETSKDILPIHTWRGDEELGDNLLLGTSPDPNTASPQPDIVVIIRGELLRRYPNTVIYMAEAAWDANGTARVPKVIPPRNNENHIFPHLQRPNRRGCTLSLASNSLSHRPGATVCQIRRMQTDPNPMPVGLSSSKSSRPNPSLVWTTVIQIPFRTLKIGKIWAGPVWSTPPPIPARHRLCLKGTISSRMMWVNTQSRT